MATKTENRALYKKAHEAGLAAGKAAIPEAMVVGSSKGFVGPSANQIDYSKPTYYVSEGVCGFAWVHLTNGRSSFARWCRANDKSHKSYYGGEDVWVSGFGQSMTRKEAYARAFAEVLREAGIDAYAQSRMD